VTTTLRRRFGPSPMAVALILVIVAVGTAGYMVLEGASFMDALYMTAITISTVGYGETVPLTSTASRLFTIGLLVFGIGGFFWAINEMAQFTVRQQIQATLGRRSVERILDALTGHIIVCGFGRMGRGVVQELLAEGQKVAVVESDPVHRDALRDLGVPFVIGDASDEATLARVHLDTARTLIAATGSDAINVYVSLTARSAAPDLFIVARADTEQAEPKLLRAGANRVVSLYRIGAERMVGTALRPAVVNVMELALPGRRGGLQIEQARLQQGAPLCNRTLGESALRTRFGVTLLAVERPDGQLFLNPDGDTVLAAGDTLVVLGSSKGLADLAPELSPA
jgi:voltage-gated potassium channel